MKIINGLVFDLERGFIARELYTKNDVITSTASDASDDPIVDASGCYVIPGLVDVHFHGCCGEDFLAGGRLCRKGLFPPAPLTTGAWYLGGFSGLYCLPAPAVPRRNVRSAPPSGLPYVPGSLVQGGFPDK